MTKIPKSDQTKYKELVECLENLADDIESLSNGKTARLKSALATLRVLVGEPKKGALEKICEKYNLTPSTTFKGLEGFPKTNPRSRDSVLTLEEYLNVKIVAAGVSMTRKEYIYKMACENASHLDENQSPEIMSGENIVYNGFTENARQVIFTGKVILSMGKQVAEYLKEKYPHLSEKEWWK